jgi:cell wall-associated NlpC family hydrolase
MRHSQARRAVADEALTWLRTPYAHRQQLKGVGVDCAQFPLAVYAAVGVIAPVDAGLYCPQWHLHRSEELYLDAVRRLAREIAAGDARPGDFAVWRYGRTFSHGAILLEGTGVIHALRGVGVTLGDRAVDEDLRTRPMRVFSPWAV